MFLTRTSWFIYSTVTLAGFALAMTAVFLSGQVLMFFAGAAWCWTLTRWVDEHRTRRRGWKVITREDPEDGVRVCMFVKGDS